MIHEASNLLLLLQTTRRVRPSILLLDLTWPVFCPAKHMPLLLRDSPDTKIIAFVSMQTVREAVSLLKAGVKGYASINLDVVLLNRAIQMVQKGEIWIERKLFSEVLNELLSSKTRTHLPSQDAAFKKLSPRERQIALSVANGSSNKQIAAQLQISEATVKAHLTNIFSKLGLSDRLSLALFLHGDTALQARE
jgi:DNA-binding NarL/FixJ family response regulator